MIMTDAIHGLRNDNLLEEIGDVVYIESVKLAVQLSHGLHP